MCDGDEACVDMCECSMTCPPDDEECFNGCYGMDADSTEVGTGKGKKAYWKHTRTPMAAATLSKLSGSRSLWHGWNRSTKVVRTSSFFGDICCPGWQGVWHRDTGCGGIWEISRTPLTTFARCWVSGGFKNV